MTAAPRAKNGRFSSRVFSSPLCLAALNFAAAVPARAQQPAAEPPARIIVIGDGSVSVAPDYADIGCGITTKAKTAKEATDANSKAMAAVAAALHGAGIEQKDIQHHAVFAAAGLCAAAAQRRTEAHRLFGVEPVPGDHPPDRQCRRSSRPADRGGRDRRRQRRVLHSDTSKALDQARTAAIADAKRKAELYAGRRC